MPDNQKPLPGYISSLLLPEVYDHTTENIRLIETHISWVILTGTFAYKIKKPVNLGFLDFSTLEKRHFYCNEELRLNSKLAPDIYLDVAPVTGSKEYAIISGTDPIIDYAIKMLQFPQDMQLDNMLIAGLLKAKHIDALANMVASFHQQTDIANENDSYGEPEKVYKPVKENFILIRQLIDDDRALGKLCELEKWSTLTFTDLTPIFVQRKRDGFIRECHGDLHLHNLALINEIPVAFDCIEFDPELRWIDPISDIAFLIMDLQERQKTDFAYRFLNTYLEKTGDYSACQILRFYLVYRAMVRAKVEAIRSSQGIINTLPQQQGGIAFQNYLSLATSYLHTVKPMLIITCGMSASGKSTLTQTLAEKLAAIRLRSDIERKRQFNIAPENHGSAAFNAGIYSPEATQQTYHRLAELATLVLNANYSVIIDATCLQYEQRALFRQVATTKNIPFIILAFSANPNTLRQRINSREKAVSDADQSILEQQLINWKQLHKNEQPNIITIDTERQTDISSLLNKIALYHEENKLA